jgi:hypothetical protein
VTFRLIAISLRQILRLLLFRSRSSRSKDLELLVLRQEVDVLHRQVVRPRFRPEERLILSVLQFLRPARDRLSSLVTPDTIVAGTARWCGPMALPPPSRLPREDPRTRPAPRLATGEREPDLGLLPHSRRAQEGGGRDLHHRYPAHLGDDSTAAASSRDLATVHADPSSVSHRL